MWGMTYHYFWIVKIPLYFNPHPPMWGMTRIYTAYYNISEHFNPHPPMWGMTLATAGQSPEEIFQSTSPYVGDDKSQSHAFRATRYFNPHPPMWGMTLFLVIVTTSLKYFNPHPPMWGMTFTWAKKVRLVGISIHIPLCGG